MFAEFISGIVENWELLAISSAAILLAAIVRGFSGFGFSLLSITAISLIMPVAQIVPSIFLLEVAASINMIPGIWREIDWRSLRWLMLGYVIGLPIGTYALIAAPADPAQVLLSLFVITTAVMMLRGFRLEETPGPAASTGTGAASGLLNGAFGIGGPPVVLFYLSTPGAAAIGRASIIFFFLFTDLLGVGYFATQGLVTQQSFVQFIFWMPTLLFGVWIGAHAFRRIDQATFRRWVLIILIALAMLGAGKAIVSMLQ
jgi:uncharacterized protein